MIMTIINGMKIGLAPGVEDQAEDEQRRLAESVSRYARKNSGKK